MMRVLIADDEVYICALLKYLIDWDGLGLSLAQTFSDGQAVLDYLQTNEADILLCDIEMPGLDGIELMKALSVRCPGLKTVVVSGFRNFEYVRAAMKYGACNYLLKPIDEKELNEVLRQVVASVREASVRESMIMRASGRLELLSQINRPSAAGEIAAVNRRYGYHLCAGVFRILAVVFPGIPVQEDAARLIAQTFEEILRPRLADFCHEFEFYRENEMELCILTNCTTESAAGFAAALDGILRSAMVELGCKTQNEPAVGVGLPVQEFTAIYTGYCSARQTLATRLFQPQRKIFYAAGLPEVLPAAGVLSAEGRSELARCIESIDPDSAQICLKRLLHANDRLFAAKPFLVQAFCEETVRLTLEKISTLRAEDPSVTEQALRAAQLRLKACRTAAALEEALQEFVNEQIHSRLEDKLEHAAAYAQQTKQYIDSHYAEPVTLEQLAGQLNINPAYLSVVFKNEFNMNYSKYLTMVRMEKAKELLRRCDLNLTEISRAVGYNRTAYFTNIFKTYTGLRPREYQRLYQKGMGE